MQAEIKCYQVSRSPGSNWNNTKNEWSLKIDGQKRYIGSSKKKCLSFLEINYPEITDIIIITA